MQRGVCEAFEGDEVGDIRGRGAHVGQANVVRVCKDGPMGRVDTPLVELAQPPPREVVHHPVPVGGDARQPIRGGMAEAIAVTTLVL